MKKTIFCILVFFITLTYSHAIVKAEWEDPLWGYADISIIWYDYGDSLNIRPNEITLEFLDTKDYTNRPRITLNAADCEITDLGDRIRTKWVGSVKLPKTDSRREDPVYNLVITYDNMYDSNYKCISSKGVITFGDPYVQNEPFSVELWPTGSLNQQYTFKLEYDDDNDRDGKRSLIEGKKYKITSNIGVSENNIIFNSRNDYTYVRNLQTFRYDENNLLDLSVFAEYSLEPDYHIDPIIKHDGTESNYTYRLEKNGLNITLYAIYNPDKYSRIPISIDFKGDTHEKPASLNVNLVSENEEDKTLTLNKSNNYTSAFSDIYYWKSSQEKAEYLLNIEDTSDWKFNITGNLENGFVINASYIGNDISSETDPEPPQVLEQLDENIKKEDSPQTGDRIIIYIATLTIAILGIIFIIKKKVFYKKEK